MRTKIFSLTFLLGCIIALSASNLYAQDADITSARISATILQNGEVRIQEHYTYRFEGVFDRTNRSILLTGSSVIDSLQVTEGNTLYEQNPSKEQGSFQIFHNNDSLRIQWYFRALNEIRSFSLQYTINKGTVVGPSWSEFNWEYIGIRKKADIEQAIITINLPESIQSNVFTWVHSSVADVRRSEKSRSMEFRIPEVEENKRVSIRTVFPTTFIPGTAVTDSNYSLAKTRSEEAVYAEQQRTQTQTESRQYRIGFSLMILISALSFLSLTFIYLRFGQRPTADAVSSIDIKELTSSYSPAELGYLLYKKIHSNQIFATLLDLARHGLFRIVESTGTGWFSSDTFIVERTQTDADVKTMRDHEVHLYNFVSDQLLAGNNRLSKLFKASGIQMQTFTSEWKRQFTETIDSHDWFDRKSEQWQTISIIVQAVFVGGSLLNLILTGPIGLIATGISAVLMLGSFGISHRTEKGRKVLVRAKRYKQQLENNELSPNKLDPAIHYIYSVALGVVPYRQKLLLEQLELEQITDWIVLADKIEMESETQIERLEKLTSTGIGSVSGFSSTGTISFGGLIDDD